jgi:hypothetical protein
MIRQESDVYALDVLAKLEEDLLRSLSVIRNGMRKLEGEPEPEMAEVEPSAE